MLQLLAPFRVGEASGGPGGYGQRWCVVVDRGSAEVGWEEEEEEEANVGMGLLGPLSVAVGAG